MSEDDATLFTNDTTNTVCTKKVQKLLGQIVYSQC